jgi:hypothetical protein
MKALAMANRLEVPEKSDLSATSLPAGRPDRQFTCNSGTVYRELGDFKLAASEPVHLEKVAPLSGPTPALL